MQVSANWGTDYVRRFGANIRSGASDITDPDYTNYPAFHFNQLQGSAVGQNSNPYMHMWWIKENIFPLNQPIDDWSFAYTAVDSEELSHTNIGVFDSADYTNPKYKTDNTDIQQIAFVNNLRYTVNVTDHGARPQWSGVPQFPTPPYNNNLYVYNPNAAGTTPDPVTMDISQINFNGYATTIRSFGIKSWFLEIRVSTVFIGGADDSPLPLADYSLKDYLTVFTQHERDVNPISRAFARVYIRNSTAGTYDHMATDFWQFYPVLSTPFSGNGINNILCYFNLVNSEINITNKLELPLFGIPVNRSTFSNRIYKTPQNGFLDFFYGYDRISGVTNITTDNCVFYMNPTVDNIEYLRRSCAGYGLFFCDDHISYDDDTDLAGGSAESTRWTHTDMMLGTIEDDGYTRGNYTHGAANATARQFNWTDSTESTYDPDVPPTPTENEYDTHTVFNTISDTATLFKRYVLNDTNVRQLGLDLFDVCDDIAGDDPNEPYKNYAAMINSNFLTNNPIDCIISLQRFPMSIPKDDNTPENIKLGRVSVNAIGYETTQTNYEYSFTGKTIFPCFGDSFLDYNPYTTYELYIPFCGTVRLDPADILYRQLNVYLNVDFSTGTCTGYVMSDNLVIETVSGNIAIDIPVTGIASATVNANLNNAIVAYQNSKIKQIENIAGTIGYGIKAGAGVMKFAATGDTDNLAFGGGFRQIMDNVRGNIGGDKANYDLQHQIVSPHVIGSASSVGLWAIDLNCRLICYYPTGDVIDVIGGKPQFTNKIYNYGIQNGFATCETNTIASYGTGLVVGVNPLLYNITTANGRPATQTELDMIENAIKEGVILPPVG